MYHDFYDLDVTCKNCGSVWEGADLIRQKYVQFLLYNVSYKYCVFRCPQCGEYTEYKVNKEKSYDYVIRERGDLRVVVLNGQVRLQIKDRLSDHSLGTIVCSNDRYVVLQDGDMWFNVLDLNKCHIVQRYAYDVDQSVRAMLEGRSDRAVCRLGPKYLLFDRDFNIIQRFPASTTIIIHPHITHNIPYIYSLGDSELKVHDLDGQIVNVYEFDRSTNTSIYDYRYIALTYQGSNTYFDMHKCEFVEGTGVYKTVTLHGNCFVLGRNDSEICIFNRLLGTYYTISLEPYRQDAFSPHIFPLTHFDLFIVDIWLLSDSHNIFVVHKNYDLLAKLRIPIDEYNNVPTTDTIVELCRSMYYKQLIACNIEV